MAKTTAQSVAQPVTRARRTSSKARVEQETIHASHDVEVDEATLLERLQQNYDALLNKLGVASPRRYLCGLALGFVVTVGASYFMAGIISWLAMAALVASGSAFLGTVITVLGYIAAFFISYKAGSTMFDYVVTKRVDAHWNKLKSSVSSLWSAKAKPVQA